MKQIFFGALLLSFTSLAACSGNSGSGESKSSRASEDASGTGGTTTTDVPASASDPSRATNLDTVVVDTNVRGNP